MNPASVFFSDIITSCIHIFLQVYILHFINPCLTSENISTLLTSGTVNIRRGGTSGQFSLAKDHAGSGKEQT